MTRGQSTMAYSTPTAALTDRPRFRLADDRAGPDGAVLLIVLFPLLFTIFTSAFDYTLAPPQSTTPSSGSITTAAAFAEDYFGEVAAG